MAAYLPSRQVTDDGDSRVTSTHRASHSTVDGLVQPLLGICATGAAGRRRPPSGLGCPHLRRRDGRRPLRPSRGSGADQRVGFGVQLSDIFAFAAAALGTAVYLVARGQRLSPRRLLDLRLFLQVAGAFGIAAGELPDGALPSVDRLFAFVPVECVWIVLFPLVVPNTPTKVLVASLLAASMGPAALGLSAAVHGTPIDRPLVVAAFYLTSNYLCAVIAYLVARIVHRFNMRLKHLREIGSYELIERIGEGGMGEVWRARHRLLARPAAIKLIPADVLRASQRTRDRI